MKPISFIKKDNKTIFRYKFSDLREFVKLGYESGNVGMIRISMSDENLVKYKGFGTIEHPVKFIQTITLKHNEIFDGPILRNVEPKKELSEYQYVLLDLSGNENHRIIKA